MEIGLMIDCLYADMIEVFIAEWPILRGILLYHLVMKIFIPLKCQRTTKYIYIVGAKRDKYFIVVDSNEQQIIDGSFEQVEFRDDIICLLRNDEWYFYDKNFKFITKYERENVRLWQWIGINVNGRWLPFDKVVNY